MNMLAQNSITKQPLAYFAELAAYNLTGTMFRKVDAAIGRRIDREQIVDHDREAGFWIAGANGVGGSKSVATAFGLLVTDVRILALSPFSPVSRNPR